LTTETDLSTWASKPQAAAALGISERTLDRLIAEGKGPERRLRRREGKRPEPVYNPIDLDTLAAAQPALLHPDSPLGRPTTAIAARREYLPPLHPAALALMDRLITMAQPAQPPPARPWLTIPEASAYTGLSGTLLRRLVREKRLPAIRDRAVKLRRSDLDRMADFHAATLARSRGRIL